MLLGIILGALGGFSVGFFTAALLATSKRADKRGEQLVSMIDNIAAPLVEVEITHVFRSAPQLVEFRGMVPACAWLADRFRIGGFSQIVLTQIDEHDEPADVPDYWEKSEQAIESEQRCDECATEDPAPWCDCQPGETCSGPCRQRAHTPGNCYTERGI